jgi:HK97 family phage major capsid protein
MSVTETRSSADLVPALIEQADKIAGLRNLHPDQRGDGHLDDVRKATAEMHALDAEYSVRSRVEKDALERAAYDHAVANPAKPESRGPSAAFAELGPEHRGIFDLLTDSPEYKQWVDDGAKSHSFDVTLEGRSLVAESRTLLDTTVGTGPSYFMPVGTPQAPAPRQMKFFLRDVLNVSKTGLHVIPYIRELNPATTESGASTVAEGIAKPEAVTTFELDNAVVQKIAVWIPATMEILADAPTLQGYVYQRLAYMLQVREQQQCLTGNGVTPDLKGILNYSGIQTVTTATNADPFVDFATAIGKIENVDGNVNGIAMNPIDFWTTIGLRHSTQFDGGVNNGNAPFGGPAGTVWGLPVIRTRALTTLTAVVADWTAATLFDRMETNIRQSDSHDTFFILNKIAILAEERVALAVTRPDLFCKVTIDITP